MASNNTTGDIGYRTSGYAVAKLLERGQFLMVLERFGQVDPQPKNKTNIRRYRRYNSLARALAPLAEGVSPSGQKLTYTDVIVTLEQYGDVVNISDRILDTLEDPVLNEAAKICGEQVADTVECIRFSVLKAGTNVYYPASATTRATVNSPITRGVLREVYRQFKRNKAREITEVIAATAKIATEPVGAAYFVLGHTDLYGDFKNLSGFVPIEKYADGSKALAGEIGKIDNMRIVLSALFEPFLAAATSESGSTYLTNGAAGTGYPDVYPVLVLAKDAYAMVPLQGANAIDIAVVNPKPVIGDELGQRGFVSWKTMQGTGILNQLWLARIEVAATATLD